MLNVTITESTPANMLRAIKAACDELLKDAAPECQTMKNDERAAQHVTNANRLNTAASAELDEAAASLSAHNVQGGPVEAGQFYPVGKQPVPGVDIPGPEDMLAPADADPSVERDSTGAEWDAELHASTKTKNQDGTWKKKRGVAPPAPPTPPTPPAATTADPDSEKKIWALISGGVVTINQVQEVSAKHGCADLGALRGASADVKAAVLAELEQIA